MQAHVAARRLGSFAMGRRGHHRLAPVDDQGEPAEMFDDLIHERLSDDREKLIIFQKLVGRKPEYTTKGMDGWRARTCA
jgi:hypothetical protein